MRNLRRRECATRDQNILPQDCTRTTHRARGSRHPFCDTGRDTGPIRELLRTLRSAVGNLQVVYNRTSRNILTGEICRHLVVLCRVNCP
jgi:hypothetical protein